LGDLIFGVVKRKTILMGLFTLSTFTVFSQQHILDNGTIAPCYAANNPHLRTDDENVTIILNEEMPVHPHVQGKVVSVFHVGDTWNVLVKTDENFYVKFGNLKQAAVKKGDDIEYAKPIGIPLPGSNAGTWKLLVSYDTKTETLPCAQVIEMIRLSRGDEFVVGGVSR
jgi:hypothetical protein